MDQLVLVVDPTHDHPAGAFGNRILFEGTVNAEGEDIAMVALPENPHVGQSRARDGVLADLGQAVTPLVISTQDSRGFGQPVQAVEPLADQPGALKSRTLG